MVVTITISVRELWKEPYSGMADRVVRSDVKGYYGYLQALFIRHDGDAIAGLKQLAISESEAPVGRRRIYRNPEKPS